MGSLFGQPSGTGSGGGHVGGTYVGGHPAVVEKVKEGLLQARAGGGVAYVRVAYANMLRTETELFAIGGPDLLAMSVGDPGKMKAALGGLVPIGEDFSVGVGALFRGGTALTIAAAIDGVRHVLAFKIENDEHGKAFLTTVQRARAQAGLDPVPTLEGEGPQRAARDQAATLDDIKQLLAAQQGLLERIAAAVETPSS